jgi:hypothetical protein
MNSICKKANFFFLGGNRVWTQGFTLARQVLCHFRYTSSTFCSGSFGDGGLADCLHGLVLNLSTPDISSHIARITACLFFFFLIKQQCSSMLDKNQWIMSYQVFKNQTINKCIFMKDLMINSYYQTFLLNLNIFMYATCIYFQILYKSL